MAEITGALARYIAVRDQQRRDDIAQTLASFTDRETMILREAAVMGYVQGGLAARGGQHVIPADSAIVHRVVDACRAMPDLYPTLGEGAA